jgi:hypothetical protein
MLTCLSILICLIIARVSFPLVMRWDKMARYRANAAKGAMDQLERAKGIGIPSMVMAHAAKAAEAEKEAKKEKEAFESKHYILVVAAACLAAVEIIGKVITLLIAFK